MVYMIENGFADPKREADWNTWYTHHVTRVFRAVPGWRTGQRFKAIPPSAPKYRAMYTVESAEVMRSPEYQATTAGRFPEEWLSAITDFHRNLADGHSMPAVQMDQCLIVADPPATDADVPGIALTWWNVVDLDRSVPRRGIAVVDKATGERLAQNLHPNVGVYAPIFEQYVQ